MKTISKLAGPFLALGISAVSANAGTVVVNADEWALSNTGFTNGVGVSQFVQNLVNEFGTTLHAFSTNFGYTQSSLATAMGNSGATFTTGTGFAFTEANLSAYDGIFLAGNQPAVDFTVLQNYLTSGGNVYISAGTAQGFNAGTEAAYWNPFLNPLGLSLSGPYTGQSGAIAVSGDPLFSGVTSLYVNNPNGMSGAGVVCCGTGNELFGVVRMDAPVPLPAGGALLVSGLALAAGLKLRKRR